MESGVAARKHFINQLIGTHGLTRARVGSAKFVAFLTPGGVTPSNVEPWRSPNDTDQRAHLGEEPDPSVGQATNY